VLAIAGNSAALLGLTIAIGVVMTRLGIRDGVLRLRSEHRCVACGTLVEARVCPRCGEAR
jgi:rRNA maturation endonuclease Nob1